MNKCQAGHGKHERLKVQTTEGEMVCYNWDLYKGFSGYCTGQDDISRTLINSGIWSPTETEFVKKLLEDKKYTGAVWDIGSHIGWFSRIAYNLGYRIKAFDGDEENLELLRINIPTAQTKALWFDENTKVFKAPCGCRDNNGIKFCKIDIEGNERFAIKSLENYLCMGLVENMMIEVSPIFNAYYPDMISQLENEYNMTVFELDGTPFNHDYAFEQRDLWIKKK